MQDRKRRKLQVGQYMINDNLFSTSLKKLNYKPRAKEILRVSKYFFISKQLNGPEIWKHKVHQKVWVKAGLKRRKICESF